MQASEAVLLMPVLLLSPENGKTSVCVGSGVLKRMHKA
jgi:hypothetical protein